MLATNPMFDKLITSLRTAVDSDGTLDKEAILNDIFDAFRLAMKFYHFEEYRDVGLLCNCFIAMNKHTKPIYIFYTLYKQQFIYMVS